MCIHTGDLGLQFTRRTFVESAQNLTPEKSQGGRKAQHITVSHPYDDHARLCITLALAFESECSCSAPLTPQVTYRQRHCCWHCCWHCSYLILNGQTVPNITAGPGAFQVHLSKSGSLFRDSHITLCFKRIGENGAE